MKKKTKNIILGTLVAGALATAPSCVKNDGGKVEFEVDKDKKSSIQIELENTHDYWVNKGADCANKDSCVIENLRYYNNSPRDVFGGTSVGVVSAGTQTGTVVINNESYSDASRFQGTIKRSEIRHAASKKDLEK